MHGAHGNLWAQSTLIENSLFSDYCFQISHFRKSTGKVNINVWCTYANKIIKTLCHLKCPLS